MTDTSTVARDPAGRKPARRPLLDDRLADELPGKAQAEGVELSDCQPAATTIIRYRGQSSH